MGKGSKYVLLPVDILHIVTDFMEQEDAIKYLATLFDGINHPYVGFISQLKIFMNNLSSEYVRAISTLTDLQYLDIGSTEQEHITYNTVKFLVYLTNLTHLGILTFNEISDTGLIFLSSLPNLISLILNWGYEIKGPGINYLAQPSKLRELDLGYSQITDLESLSVLINLQKLNLESSNKIKELKSLLSLTNLTYLNLAYCKEITNNNIKFLTSKKFQYLNFTSVRTSDIALMTNLIELHELILSDTKVKDNDLQTIGDFTNLQILRLNDCTNIADHGLSFLYNLTNLQILDLDNCNKITDNGLSFLQNLNNLEKLIFG